MASSGSCLRSRRDHPQAGAGDVLQLLRVQNHLPVVLGFQLLDLLLRLGGLSPKATGGRPARGISHSAGGAPCITFH